MHEKTHERKNALRTHRSYVETEHVLDVRRQLGDQGVEAPILTHVCNDDRPERQGREYGPVRDFVALHKKNEGKPIN